MAHHLPGTRRGWASRGGCQALSTPEICRSFSASPAPSAAGVTAREQGDPGCVPPAVFWGQPSESSAAKTLLPRPRHAAVVSLCSAVGAQPGKRDGMGGLERSPRGQEQPPWSHSSTAAHPVPQHLSVGLYQALFGVALASPMPLGSPQGSHTHPRRSREPAPLKSQSFPPHPTPCTGRGTITQLAINDFFPYKKQGTFPHSRKRRRATNPSGKEDLGEAIKTESDEGQGKGGGRQQDAYGQSAIVSD